MYGYEAKSLEDPCVVAADESAVIGASLLLPGANFINILPILGRIPAWVPGAKSVRMAAEADRLTAEVKRIPMEYTKRRMVRTLWFTTHFPSFQAFFCRLKEQQLHR